MSEPLRCWCGNSDLVPFSAQYRRCPACETLVLAERPEAPLGQVRDDDQDFYGKRYWFEHQERDLGLSNLVTRARQDLPERCVYWLRTLLRYKIPPAASLELGSSHGAFVALLRWAGFDATGLEMSPWVADFARQTFKLPVLVGPLENQTLEPGSLGIVAAMDVVEHLEDPLATVGRAVSLLQPDGVLLLQTPCYPAGKTYEELQAAQSPFLAQLQAPEHVFLYSEPAMRELLRRVGIEHLTFEPAIFAHYDMFLAGSRQPLRTVPPEAIAAALAASPSGRLLEGLLDLYADREAAQRDLAEEAAHVGWLKQSIVELERDRAARLQVLLDQGARLGRIPTLEADIAHLSEQLRTAEQDREARLAVIERQGDDLGRIGALEADIAYLKQQIETAEADRAARLAIIELQREDLARIPLLDARLAQVTGDSRRLDDELSSKNAIIQDQQRELAALSSRLTDLEREVSSANRSSLVRLLRKLGF